MSEPVELSLSVWTITVLDALRLPGESLEDTIERLLVDGLAYQRRLEEKFAHQVAEA